MPRPPLIPLAIAATMLLPALAAAQLLPGVGQTLPGVIPDVVGGVTGTLGLDQLERLSPVRAADRLLAARTERLAQLVTRNPQSVALDDRGQPARRDSILVTGIDDAGLKALRTAGYSVNRESIDGLDISVARVALTEGSDLARELKRVRKLTPGAEASGDTLYFTSGSGTPLPAASSALAGASGDINARLGLIDGGVAAHPALSQVEQRGFAKGAPMPSEHGTAVASLIVGKGPIQGAAPGNPLLVGDVYGDDPAGGGALAIARAFGWMIGRGVKIVTISLVGPDNPLLRHAVGIAQRKGMTIVAAVGNDGPAAPPSYPASWPGVIAVTGVDGRERVLIEAGRALHVDFAAPGAEMRAATTSGGSAPVRGTSFAAPLVAGSLYSAQSIEALAKDAKDLGKKGPDKVYGRGLICGSCRNMR